MDFIKEVIRYDTLIVVALVDRESSQHIIPLFELLLISTQSLRLGFVKHTTYLSVYGFVLPSRAIPTSTESTQTMS